VLFISFIGGYEKGLEGWGAFQGVFLQGAGNCSRTPLDEPFKILCNFLISFSRNTLNEDAADTNYIKGYCSHVIRAEKPVFKKNALASMINKSNPKTLKKTK
jgi:hypothetical protein